MLIFIINFLVMRGSVLKALEVDTKQYGEPAIGGLMKATDKLFFMPKEN